MIHSLWQQKGFFLKVISQLEVAQVVSNLGFIAWVRIAISHSMCKVHSVS